MGWVVEHGEAVLANDALADPRALHIPGTPNDQPWIESLFGHVKGVTVRVPASWPGRRGA